ncbi:uncharacterized protein Z519_12110 [Cladophialophora bantiana CBS 173.52]|uniref:Uncharacterized protein n=1 Tax=Cladophialophora bantiana (strain ATCC 10958 / CBS 173.52 / CDC B-1940 / NIH 8579) TaxID=1442370 RepID=A0A0D2H1Q0_CLAB1|nr:uncharacterized protein Z519_12110 [Cladophialophora bantiana CBS 173.52]KIW87208.1 hypothetical protein Z519_12110 [Cladophialophora bantiana CBS 173.52]
MPTPQQVILDNPRRKYATLSLLVAGIQAQVDIALDAVKERLEGGNPGKTNPRSHSGWQFETLQNWGGNLDCNQYRLVIQVALSACPEVICIGHDVSHHCIFEKTRDPFGENIGYSNPTDDPHLRRYPTSGKNSHFLDSRSQDINEDLEDSLTLGLRKMSASPSPSPPLWLDNPAAR